MNSPRLEPGNQKARKPRALGWMCSWVHSQNGTSTWARVHPGPTRTGNVQVLATFCLWPSHILGHTHFQKGSFLHFLLMVIQKILSHLSYYHFHKPSLRLANRNICTYTLSAMSFLILFTSIVKGIISSSFSPQLDFYMWKRVHSYDQNKGTNRVLPPFHLPHHS